MLSFVPALSSFKLSLACVHLLVCASGIVDGAVHDHTFAAHALVMDALQSCTGQRTNGVLCTAWLAFFELRVWHIGWH
jgi:hypothetical protein